MNWEILPLTNQLGSWSGIWDDLNARLYNSHPFSDSRFVNALLKHFGNGTEHLCIHRSVGNIDGLLILRYRGRGIWTQFVPSQAPAIPILVENADILRGLFSSLSPFAWLIELLNMDPEFCPSFPFNKDFCLRIVPHALTININLKSSFERYWETRSKGIVQNMRRYQRRIENELGLPVLQILVDPHLMHDAVVHYGELESNGWKGYTGTAVNIKNKQSNFYSEVMTTFSATGQAEISEYRVDQKLIASRLIIFNNSIKIMLKTTYDENLARFAPGRLHLRDTLQYIFRENQHNSVEFYTNATQDQLAWATGQRHISHVMIFRTALYARAYDLYHTIRLLLQKYTGK